MDALRRGTCIPCLRWHELGDSESQRKKKAELPLPWSCAGDAPSCDPHCLCGHDGSSYRDDGGQSTLPGPRQTRQSSLFVEVSALGPSLARSLGDRAHRSREKDGDADCVCDSCYIDTERLSKAAKSVVFKGRRMKEREQERKNDAFRQKKIEKRFIHVRFKC